MMDNKEITYCLLCAHLKCFNELMHIENDVENLDKTVEKLTRLNILYPDFKGIIPKTICLSCMESLNKAFEFVVEVEKAQRILKELHESQIEKGKSQEEDRRDNILDTQSCYNVHIEQEFSMQTSSNCSMVSEDLKMICSKEPSRKGSKGTNSNLPSLKHLKLTWNNYLWTCMYCETQFTTIEELKIHTMRYHQCCSAFKCNDCNARKFHLERFIFHVKRHRKYLELTCYRCNREFNLQHELQHHMRAAHAPRTNHACLRCATEFQSTEELEDHNRTFNRGKRSKCIPDALKSVDSLSCAICKKAFKTKGTLNTHTLIHTERKREHICEKCGKCFLSKQNLAGHMLIHDNIRPYQCDVCKCTFKFSKELKNHVGIHNGDKPHTCDQCGRAFRLQKLLNSHKIMHTDSWPYICNYCEKKFRYRTTFNDHLRQHTGEKPYSCDLCNREFTNWPNYNKHMKRRHGLDMAKRKIIANNASN